MKPQCAKNDASNCSFIPQNFIANFVSYDKNLIDSLSCIIDSLSIPTGPPGGGKGDGLAGKTIDIPSYQQTNTDLVQLKSNIDNGDTQGLLNSIATEPTKIYTYQDLETASPYLSDEVLSAIVQSSAMEYWKKDTLLHKNAPLSSRIMKAVDTVLHSSTYTSLLNVRANIGISARALLEWDIEEKEQLKVLLLDTLTKLYLAGDISVQALPDTLAKEGTPFAKRAELGLYIQNKEWSNAQSLIDSLPIATQTEQNYQFTQDLALQVMTNSSFVLDSIQDTTLRVIATEKTPESAYAQALLSLLKEELFDRDLQQGNSSGSAKKEDSKGILISKELRVYPNPAKDNISILLPSDLNDNVNINFYNIVGKGIKTLSLSEGQSFISMSLKDFQSGIYLITIESHGSVLFETKLVITK